MNTIEYSVLDTGNTKDCFEYEHAFFRAFSSTEFEHIWNYNYKSKTITAKIPYSNQQVFTAKLPARVVAGIAINFGMQNRLQLEMEGFKIDKSQPAICEILAMFSLLGITTGTPVIKSLTEFLIKNLAEKEITTVYGTCDQKKVRAYELIGLTVIDQVLFKNEKVFLLEMALNKYL